MKCELPFICWKNTDKMSIRSSFPQNWFVKPCIYLVEWLLAHLVSLSLSNLSSIHLKSKKSWDFISVEKRKVIACIKSFY